MVAFDELRSMLPDKFSTTVLDGARDVLESDNPIRANLFAAAIRELLGHLLHTAAPDEEVTACSWYEVVEDRPTRRQRAKYAVQGGLADKVVDQIGIDASEMQDGLTAAFKQLNKRTHLRPGTILIIAAEIDEFAGTVIDAAVDFMATIHDARVDLISALESHASQAVFSQFVMETVADIDLLASHYSVDQADAEEVHLDQITATELHYSVNGTVYVSLEYGSSSERRAGDGATIDEDFPFSCEIVGSVDALDKVIRIDDLKVDTSSWYE